MVVPPAVVASRNDSSAMGRGTECRQTGGVSARAPLRLQTDPESECPAPAPVATRTTTATPATQPTDTATTATRLTASGSPTSRRVSVAAAMMSP